MEYSSLGTPPAGSIRFNTDSSKMEIYNGDKWWNIDSTSPQEQTGGTRGLFMGQHADPAYTNTCCYINIETTGNALDFGDFVEMTKQHGGCGSRTRAFTFGGKHPANNDEIQYATFASPGNFADFGDLSAARRGLGCFSDSTRGIASGGYASWYNTIEYITMASLGNAVDFGDLIAPTWGAGGMSSPTRGLSVSGNSPENSSVNTIQYVIIQTTGNAADFGDLTVNYGNFPGTSANAVRGLRAGGLAQPAGTQVQSIEYVTMATLGNGTDFGDFSSQVGTTASVASPTRSCTGGFYTGSYTNTIEYVQIMTTSNAIDFGDLTTVGWGYGASNGHGGLT